MNPRSRAVVYIDALNLYHGMLKNHSGRKWLDLGAWSQRLLPAYDVTGIVYCTARVGKLPHDPHAHTRQDQYLKALATLPELAVLEGTFRMRKSVGARVAETGCACCEMAAESGTTTVSSTAPCLCCASPTGQIRKPEEKGSDVNVGVNLVKGAFQDVYDVALVVSNDSDLQGAVDIARQDAGKRVIVASRVPRASAALRGDEHRQLRGAAIEACQFPESVVTPAGQTITKPAGW